MIEYNAGTWGVGFALQITGSVFPKASVWGLSAALLAFSLHFFWGDFDLRMEGVNTVWSSYNFVLGFLVVFRNNQAYARFWDGASLIQQVRGEWLNAISSLVAFCNYSEDKSRDVKAFQHLVVRLMSMLHCAALQQIADVTDDRFEVIDPAGIEQEQYRFVIHRKDRCEILLQWIQRLIVEAEQSKTLLVAPPILSRVFQELSRGMVNVHDVRKIKEIPFPFPYSQTMSVMLMVQWITTPIIASQSMESGGWAAFMSFCVVCSMWSLYYIALEIEQPFGEDSNDLPVHEMQAEMNKSLSLLLEKRVQCPPTFVLPDEVENETSLSIERSSCGMQGKQQLHESTTGSLEDPGLPMLQGECAKGVRSVSDALFTAKTAASATCAADASTGGRFSGGFFFAGGGTEARSTPPAQRELPSRPASTSGRPQGEARPEEQRPPTEGFRTVGCAAASLGDAAGGRVTIPPPSIVASKPSPATAAVPSPAAAQVVSIVPVTEAAPSATSLAVAPATASKDYSGRLESGACFVAAEERPRGSAEQKVHAFVSNQHDAARSPPASPHGTGGGALPEDEANTSHAYV